MFLPERATEILIVHIIIDRVFALLTTSYVHNLEAQLCPKIEYCY